jgi:hypothetical protein
MRIASATILLIVVAVGCGPATPTETPLGSTAVVPPSGAWPPFATAAGTPPPGVVFTVGPEGTATLMNGSDRPIWLAPPTIEVWEGPRRWVEGDVPPGSLRLDPGQEVAANVGGGSAARRVGVRIWPTGDVTETESNAPWFLWQEAGSSQPSSSFAPLATAGPTDLQIAFDPVMTCGGLRTFPEAGLDAPTGAERAEGPEFDALRAALVRYGSQFLGSAGWTWRLAGRDGTGAVFLAQRNAPGAAPWVSVEVTLTGSAWEPGAMGDCALRLVLAPGLKPVTWTTDPAFPAPRADARTLHVLLWDESCGGKAGLLGRLVEPLVAYRSDAVVITLAATPIQGIWTCVGQSGTPRVIALDEQLGGRMLLDGSRVPPAVPTAP